MSQGLNFVLRWSWHSEGLLPGEQLCLVFLFERISYDLFGSKDINFSYLVNDFAPNPRTYGPLVEWSYTRV